MSQGLQAYFPLIRSRKEVMEEVLGKEELRNLFYSWKEEEQKEFLDFCSGNRGLRILYDSFFKETLNPEYDSTRLESLLSEILHRKVQIVAILPNDSTRISDEIELLITDIVVELDDGSLANVEMQKIGLAFPGARCACYGADLLLRQYKRVRKKEAKKFSYKHIQHVYLIVIYENSPAELKRMPEVYYHHSKQVFDSGLELDLLQEFIMLPLDIFRKQRHNKPIRTKLDAWLTFLSCDEPGKIIELITAYPEFKPMYDTLYEVCHNTERVMGMFSKELREMDRNTVKYMIDEQQKVIDEQQKILTQINDDLAEKSNELVEKSNELAEKNNELVEKNNELVEKNNELVEKNNELTEKNNELQEKNTKIAEMEAMIAELKKS